ncbi:MAG: SEC-C metal-binding domain-containing protein [bacterium]
MEKLEELENKYDGQKDLKLGTEKKPARISVQTKKRMHELAKIFKENGWEYSIEVNRDEPEDITDLRILQNRPKPRYIKEKVGRNDPCPCGSGKKYKNCCGK